MFSTTLRIPDDLGAFLQDAARQSGLCVNAFLTNLLAEGQAAARRRRLAEQRGLRPGVILQCDEGNLAPGARTTILVPLTTQRRAFVFCVPVPGSPGTGLARASWANCTRLFTVDKERLRKRLGSAPPEALQAMGRAVAEVLAIG